MTDKKLEQATEIYISLIKKNDELIEYLEKNDNIPMQKSIEIKKSADRLIADFRNTREKMLKLAAVVSDDDFEEWLEMVKPYMQTEAEE